MSKAVQRKTGRADDNAKQSGDKTEHEQRERKEDEWMTVQKQMEEMHEVDEWDRKERDQRGGDSWGVKATVREDREWEKKKRRK